MVFFGTETTLSKSPAKAFYTAAPTLGSRFCAQNVRNPPRDAPRGESGSFRALLAKSRFLPYFSDTSAFYRGLCYKIAPFPINGGSGGELEFWCVVEKYSWGHSGPVPAVFTRVP